MTEFRIYYECLEQGHNYILPMVKANALNVEIKLIKRPKSATHLCQGVISAIQSLTTPDILITAISNNIEYPLVLIEFTEAVQTEDHELQRTYGAVAAYLCPMFYVKISGNKQAEKAFGGATYNPYSTPKMLQIQYNYYGFIIADWETGENIFNLQRNNCFPSCPPIIPILQETIQKSITTFQQYKENWFKHATLELSKTTSHKNYQTIINEATGAIELLKNWKEREDRNHKLNKLRYFVRSSWVGAKINRFSHAMDPDRGVLTFISFIFSETHKIFGIYALVRKMQILKTDITDLTTLRTQLRIALEKDEWLKGKDNNLSKILAIELIKIADNATSLTQEVDFQYFWKKYAGRITENKVILTLAYFLDGMYLNHNGIKLVWDRRELLGNPQGSFLNNLKKNLNFIDFTEATPTQEVKIEVDEDEVTYTIIHKLLLPNKFKIVSVSYPGAQGGGAVLPEPEKGKEQSRQYPDIIAVSPENNTDVLLNESKGMFIKSELERDTAKILQYKNEYNYKNALKQTLVAAKVIDQNDNIRNILIGVAFGTITNTPTTWQPDKVDFIFRITNRTRWAIGIFNQTLRDLIPIIEGETDFPLVYKIQRKIKQEQTELL